MLSNGKIFIIENEFLNVKISSVGAALLDGKHKIYGNFLLSIDDDEFSEGYVGKTIAPWVNRIKNGEYIVDGNKYYLPINDFTNNCALHGLVAWNEFDALSIENDSIVLQTFIYPSPSFPFKSKIQVKYTLKEDVINVHIIMKNLSHRKSPVGLCSHPYIVHPNATKIDDCYLIIEENINSKNNNKHLKTKKLENTSIDSCYQMEGFWKATLVHNDNAKYPVAITVYSNSNYMQLYTGEIVNRKGIAIEPCTCGIDMFGESKNGDFLSPFETKTLEYSIKVESN